jgi:hypothetical protein
VDPQYGFNQHGNHDTYVQQQGLVGINGPTGSTKNGYRRDLSLVLGTNTPTVTATSPATSPGRGRGRAHRRRSTRRRTSTYLQRGNTRYQGRLLSHYDINDHKSPGNFDLNIGRRDAAQ